MSTVNNSDFTSFKSSSSAFTLIEMMIAVVVIGILSALLLPRYLDLTSNANLATTNAVTAALRTGSVANAVARRAGSADAVILNQADVCSTAILSSVIGGSALPAGYTTMGFSGAPGNCSGTNTDVYCSVFYKGLYVSYAPIACAR